MRRCLDAAPFVDFGPPAFDAKGGIPPCTVIRGRGPHELRGHVRALCPKVSGVYGMIDGHGELIYVGKAKVLRTRLLSYFRPTRERKAARILKHAKAIAWEHAASEFAALLRELEVIRRWRPRCNVQGQPLRRRLAFVCLGRPPAPHVFLAATPPKTAADFFGPIPAGRSAALAVARLNDVFQLRDCPQAQEMIFPDQGQLFPVLRPPGCLRMEIGACLGPCTGACERGAYQAKVRDARRLLAGTHLEPLAALEEAMLDAAGNQAFERAAVLRDKLEALRWLTQRLERLKHARDKMSFIYPVKSKMGSITWFLIHGGRPVQALTAPTDEPSAQQACAAVRHVYGKPSAAVLRSYEHLDGTLLVSAWFRKHPQELKRTLSPDAALALCDRKPANS